MASEVSEQQLTVNDVPESRADDGVTAHHWRLGPLGIQEQDLTTFESSQRNAASHPCLVGLAFIATLVVALTIAVTLGPNAESSTKLTRGTPPVNMPSATPTIQPRTPVTMPSSLPTIQPETQVSKTSVIPIVPEIKSFETTTELYDAVDAYLADSSSNTTVAQSYGWPIGVWDVSAVESFERLFDGTPYLSMRSNPLAALFNEDISAWHVSKAVDMRSMFDGAKAFNQNLSSWDVCRVTNFQ